MAEKTKRYRVLFGAVGIWPEGSIVNEVDLQGEHERLLALGAITEALDDETSTIEPMPVPTGIPARGKRNAPDRNAV